MPRRSEPNGDALASADPRLQAHIDRIWPEASADGSPVSVDIGPPPSSHTVVESYAVLPSLRLVRFLVPLGSKSTAVAAFRTYNATRAPVSRAIRQLLAVGYAAGVADRVFTQRLTVSIDRRFPRDRWSEVLVIQHLAGVLDKSTLRAFTAVRDINPNAKSTLELIDDTAQHVGYAKLGTTEATRRLVRTEAEALQALGGHSGSVMTPQLLRSGDWAGSAYAVSAPLPSNLRRWTGDPTTMVAGMSAVARSGVVSRGSLRASAYAARLRTELESATLADDVPAVLRQWLGNLERNVTPIEFGRVHGDWIPDNLGDSKGRLVVWDWEHSSPDAPIGLDLLHWHFHQALVNRGLHAAVRKVDETAHILHLVGVPSESHRFIASLYLLDVFVRRMRLAAGGGGWNDRWFPALLEIARHRTDE